MAALLISACHQTPANIEWRAPTMGTTYTVKAVAVPAGVTRESLQVEVEAILERVSRDFSTYRADSGIARFNLSKSTDWQDASAEMVALVDVAQSMSRLTDGAFDITIGPLARLWGFGPRLGDDRVPDATEIAAARRWVDYRKLQYRSKPTALRKSIGDIQIDLNALVAGYAADLVATRLEQAGIRNYMVDMGGELRLRGHNVEGRAWSIAIERPLPGQAGVERILTLTNCAISTSGDYRNFFEVDGQRYSHVLDARSGRPIRHELTSVTVIAPTAMRADAFATAFLILGAEQGYALAARERVAALFVVRKGDGFEERPSPAFAAYPMQ